MIVNVVNRIEWTDWLTRKMPQPEAAVERVQPEAAVEQTKPDAKRIEAERAETRAARKKGEYTRDEFKKLLINRTKQEVLDLVGKPIDTSESGDIEDWLYMGITFDPLTGDRDSCASLTIEGGIVTSATFF